MKRISRSAAAGIAAAVLVSVSVAGFAAMHARSRSLEMQLAMHRQREITDIADAMTDIEINLQKLLIASGARQSVELLGETAMLSQHVENGLSRLPLDLQTAAGAMKFAGQMAQYAMALAAQVSAGGMLSAQDEAQLCAMLDACQALSAYLADNRHAIYTAQRAADGLWPQESAAIPYPSLIFDGPFSDGRSEQDAPQLPGEPVTRSQARGIAARLLGVTAERVADAADSGGRFEAYGFRADTPQGAVNVQITGRGGHLLWMMPEEAAFSAKKSAEECVAAARVWLADAGFGQMEPCFTQQYDGMTVANFAAVQDGVLLYPDQVKVQVSMESGTVVGAECTQYWLNHAPRTGLEPRIGAEEASQMLSGRLSVGASRLCVIPDDAGERLCWEFDGLFEAARYRVYVDARTGETAQILRVIDTPQGEAAI